MKFRVRNHVESNRATKAELGEHYKLDCYACSRTVNLKDDDTNCPFCGAEIVNEWRQGRGEYELQLKRAA